MTPNVAKASLEFGLEKKEQILSLLSGSDQIDLEAEIKFGATAALLRYFAEGGVAAHLASDEWRI